MSGYTPSSDFQVEIAKLRPNIVRRFYIGDSDYSEYVTKWPNFKQTVNDIKAVNVTISLANEDKTFNFFESDKTQLRNEGKIRVGVNFGAVGSEELLTVYEGTGERVRYRRGLCQFTMKDKWTELSEKLIGDSSTPVDFVNSNYLVSDIVWWLITSYGGYSAIESTSNPDIDYEAFEAYAEVYSEDSVFINCSFDGLKITEALRKIARMSDSQMFTIYTNSETKISLNRYTQTASEVLTLDNSNITDLEVTINDRDMVNKMMVSAAYSESTDFFAITVTDESSVSVDSYGIREDLEEDENVWYISSATALNFAQRVTQVKKFPYNNVKVTTTLATLNKQAGEGVEVSDALIGLGQSFRINERNINFDTGRIILEGDATRFFDGFTLDVDSLDSTDKLLL